MKYLKQIGILALLAAVSSSCLLRKEYEAPGKEEFEEITFRTDGYVDTNLNVGDLQFSEFFSDSVLVNHIEEGLANNYDVLMALENIKAAESLYKQGKALQTPSANLSVGSGYYKASNNGQFGDLVQDRMQYDATVNISWEADIWGKLKAQEQRTYMEFLKSYDAQKAIQSNLVTQLALNYYRLVALDQQLAILEETTASRKENLEVTKALYSAGDVTLVAVKRVEALLYNSESLQYETQKNIELTENAFCLLKGERAHSVHRASDLISPFDFRLETGIPFAVIQNRPDVRAAERQLMADFEGVNAAKASMYPSVQFTLAAGTQSIDVQDWFDPASFLMNFAGNLSQPLWNKRQLKTQYEVSQFQHNKSFLAFKYSVLNASHEVSNSIAIIKHLDGKITYQAKEITAYQEAVEYSEDLLLYGSANYLEVITAKQELLGVELIMVQSQLDQVEAYVQLYNALGGGWK